MAVDCTWNAPRTAKIHDSDGSPVPRRMMLQCVDVISAGPATPSGDTVRPQHGNATPCKDAQSSWRATTAAAPDGAIACATSGIGVVPDRPRLRPSPMSKTIAPQNRAETKIDIVHPLLQGAGGGGGETDRSAASGDIEAASSGRAAEEINNKTEADGDSRPETSGGGGGLLEWLGLGLEHGLKHDTPRYQMLMSPASQSHALGSTISSVLAGDNTTRVVFGARNVFVVDPVGALEDAIPGYGELTAKISKVLGASGAGVLAFANGLRGNNGMTVGPGSHLRYGDNLAVFRGRKLEVQCSSAYDKRLFGIEALLVVLAVGVQMAGDIVCVVMAQIKNHSGNDYPVWATAPFQFVGDRAQALLTELLRQVALLEKDTDQVETALVRLARALGLMKGKNSEASGEVGGEHVGGDGGEGEGEGEGGGEGEGEEENGEK